MSDASGAAESTREADRLINFSDAVVAVAVTLLALPLVDIGGPPPGGTIWGVIGEHYSQIAAFLFTFCVVGIMWLAHNRVLNGIRRYDGAVFWLNTGWLAGIVMLPWFSAMYGQSEVFDAGNSGAGDTSGVGMLYWSAMAVISLLGWLISRHLVRHPDLLRGGPRRSTAAGKRAALRGPVFAGYFLLIGVTSLFWAQLASWLPLGIIAISIWLRPTHDQLEAA